MPAFSFYENDSTVSAGTPYNNGNPIPIGEIDKGTISPVIEVHVWNGKNDPGAGSAATPLLYATNGSGDASLIFNGTPFNGFKSMLEARSCGAFGVAADQDTDWVPIRPTSFLELGSMPANTRRTIELRLNVPIDSPTIPQVSFSLQVSA